ncbi:MAG: hypothetical protein BYD32DRAFT_419038 [Podila humilis]|nr:MAG: hypothetical protein BYD32DRAFT_419038 [Podila humilis]
MMLFVFVIVIQNTDLEPINHCHQLLTTFLKRTFVDLNVAVAVDIIVTVDLAISVGIHADVFSVTTILDAEAATHKVAFGIDN